LTEITAWNILRHELIGMPVKVTRARDPGIRGRSGLIIDETRNMLTLLHRGRRFRVAKSLATFRFKLRNGTIVDVDGARLVARPENRLKMRVKRW